MSAEGAEDWERVAPPPWTGPWADDARRLFQLLQSAAEQAGSASGRESAARESAGQGPAEPAGAESAQSPGRSGNEHSPECLYCPFCQGVALLRRAGPDVLDQVSEFAAGLAATLRAAQPAPDDPSAEPAGTSTAASSGPVDHGSNVRARPPSTVRIDVTD